jgi:fimbrial chaperone protein
MKKTSLLALILMCMLTGHYSQANLLISPQRLFFEPRERMHEMLLMNTGNVELTYRVEWQELAQTETGGYEPIAPDDLNSGVLKASDYIRFSPRQVKLQPGESQKIKFVVRRKSNMQVGEYRSHVKFQALPRPNQEAQNAVGEVAIKLQVLTSFVVPIILREGAGAVAFGIDNAVVIKSTGAVSQFANILVDWSRQGTFGAVGQLAATFKPRGASEFKTVGFLNNVNFFAERDSLKTSLIWSEAPKVKEGTLKVTFTDQFSNKGKVLAQQEFIMQLPD